MSDLTEHHGDPVPVDHVLLHVHDRLAQDGRVGELGLEVVLDEAGDPGVVVVRGSVSTAERKAHVVDVVREVLRAHDCPCDVRDETDVPPTVAPPDDGGEAL